MDEFLTDIRQELLPEQSAEVYATLAKIVGNILRDPCEPKFRTLRKDNRLVANGICTSFAAVSLLYLVGFEDQEDAYHCPLATDLAQAQALSEALRCLAPDGCTPCPPPAAGEGEKPPKPPPLTPAPALPVRRIPRTNEKERESGQQLEQLRAVRASHRMRHLTSAEGSASVATAGPPRSMGLGGAAGSERMDLLSDDHSFFCPEDHREPKSCNMAMEVEAGSHQGAKKPAPRTLYDFRQRERDKHSNQQQDQQMELDEVKQLQREKYNQLRSDPSAWLPAASATSPSGDASSTSMPRNGSWLSDASKQLKDTSDRLSTSLFEASEKLSSRLSSVGEQLGRGTWTPWFACQATQQVETEETHPLLARWRVIGESGAPVHQGIEEETPLVGVLNVGTEFVCLELQNLVNGDSRLRLEVPLCGWLTLKQDIVERVTEEDWAEFG